MKRTVLLATLLLLLAAPALAQEVTPEPDRIRDDLQALVAEARAAADEARRAMEDAGRYATDASNFLGLFEAISVGITVVIGALGAFGVLRLVTAQQELTRTRDQVLKQLADALAEQRAQTEALRRELETLAAETTAGLRAESEQRAREQKESMIANALIRLGERQYRAGDHSGALQTMRRAAELDANNPDVHYRLGYIYEKSGIYDRAEDHLKHALEIDAEFAPARAALGLVYRRQAQALTGLEREEKLDEAAREIRSALRHIEHLVDEDGESWWGTLGGLYRRRGQIEAAIDAYRRAAEITPDSSYPLVNLALLYLTTGDRVSMMETFQRAERAARSKVAQHPSDSYAHADLLTTLVALEQDEEAEAIAAQFIVLAPTPARIADEADTLEQLAQILPDRAGRISRFVARLREAASAAEV
ncbi:MAG: tetratricopeptide repeat protein [Candidatus Flexifilum sp.]